VTFLSLLAGRTGVARAVYNELGYGEPYELAGKRIVFTTWYWVRPGEYNWVNDQGESVMASKKVMAEPNDPHTHWKELDFPRGIRLIAEPAQKGEFPIKPEFPWEAEGIQITSLLQLPDKILAWGECKPGGPCYFESTDGVTWNRPKLGLVNFKGSKENNLGGNGRFPGFYDPIAPAAERFKFIQNDEWTVGEFEKRYKPRRPYQHMAIEISPGKVQAVWGYTSADGLNFKRLPDPLVVQSADGGQYGYYDHRLKKYVMYLRTAMIGPRSDRFPAQPDDENERFHKFAIRTSVGRSESADFREFPVSETIIETSNDMPPSDKFQNNCYTTIPKAPDHHLLFPTRWITSEDSSAVDLYTSHDGKTWNRAGTSLLATSNYGQPDGGSVWIQNPGLTELGNGDWVIPYLGTLLPMKYARGRQALRWGLAIWPRGRLMALEAVEEGHFTTMAFLTPSNKLLINALTPRSGYVRVEAADLHGKPIPGHTFADSIPIIGDQYRTMVRWQGAEDLGVKAGEPVVLRFRMDRAKIYGLEFE
jgi:hypothetical protein